jgi:hypothetical protein
MDTNSKNNHHMAKCRVCKQILDTRLKRNFLLKTLFFWLPVRVYFCTKCATKRYVIHHKENYSEASTA